MSFCLNWRIWKTMRNTFDDDDDDDLNAWMRICDRMTDNNREIIIISVILAAVFFTGLFGFCCAQQKKVDAAEEQSMFEIVEYHDTIPSIVIVYHKKTKVMYMMPKNGSVATVMVDADGKPLLYEP